MPLSANAKKYFIFFEGLKLDKTVAIGGPEWQENLLKLKNFNKVDLSQALKKLLEIYDVPNKENLKYEEHNDEMLYAFSMALVMTELMQKVDFDTSEKDELISCKNFFLFIKLVNHMSHIFKHLFLHKNFMKKDLKRSPINFELIPLAIEFFAKVLNISMFHMMSPMESVVKNHFLMIYSFIYADVLGEVEMTEKYANIVKEHLNSLWNQTSKPHYFLCLMMINGSDNLPILFKKIIRGDLLNRLTSPGGFGAFVARMYMKKKDTSEQQIFGIVSNIVSSKAYTSSFHQKMIDPTWKFLRNCVANEELLEHMGAGLLSLRKLYDLKPEFKEQIIKLVADEMEKFINPPDVLTGLVIMENRDFVILIHMLFQIFCTSIVECLPTEILVPYVPVLFSFYYQIPDSYTEKQRVGTCIVRCLHNRNENELTDIIVNLYTNRSKTKYHYLHPKIIIAPNEDKTEVNVKICEADAQAELQVALALSDILMRSDFHLLTLRVFLVLFRLMVDELDNPPTIALMQTEEELNHFINFKYLTRVNVLLTLSSLITHEPLKTKLSEHTDSFLGLLELMIDNILSKKDKSTKSDRGEQDEVLVLVLAIAEELFQETFLIRKYQRFIPKLKQLLESTKQQWVQQHINNVIHTLMRDPKVANSFDTNPYNTARGLIESKEPHLQVYGIQMVIDLIKRRDTYTMTRGHALLAMALTTLKNKESYTFLNTVRLITVLVPLMKADVLLQLSGEYNEERLDLDYRLVVGEALLKVSEELGILCFEWKSTLINCFMEGCRSPVDEFRMSSFANLGQLCKNLIYQVQNFFQELLNLIACELSTGKYIGSKRAAVLVLAELLAGMPNITDFGEMLLPIYRLLKHINANSTDDQMRLHASKGLTILADKCRKFFLPEEQLEKEIKILGIEKKKPNLKGCILDMNEP